MTECAVLRDGRSDGAFPHVCSRPGYREGRHVIVGIIGWRDLVVRISQSQRNVIRPSGGDADGQFTWVEVLGYKRQQLLSCH